MIMVMVLIMFFIELDPEFDSWRMASDEKTQSERGGLNPLNSNSPDDFNGIARNENNAMGARENNQDNAMVM